MAHANDAPLVFVLVLVLCLAAVFASLTSQQMTSKLVALLGILTALSAVLRTIPGPAGFNAIFLLPILSGYCYGPAFGFMLGVLSLLVSALIGGGVGPWLPYQMLATGWVGLLSGFLPELKGHRRLEPVMLAVWGGVLGLIFGAIMNIWFWPFLAGGASGFDQTEGGVWQPGMSVLATVRSYLTFYVVTSLWWDAWRAAGQCPAAALLRRADPARDAPVPQPLPVRHRPGGHRDAPSAGSCRGAAAERLRRENAWAAAAYEHNYTQLDLPELAVQEGDAAPVAIPLAAELTGDGPAAVDVYCADNHASARTDCC